MPIDTSLASLTATQPSGPAAATQADPAGTPSGDAFGGHLRDALRPKLPSAPTSPAQSGATRPANPPVVADAADALDIPVAPGAMPEDLSIQATLPSAMPLPSPNTALKSTATAAASAGGPTTTPRLAGRAARSAEGADEREAKAASEDSTDGPPVLSSEAALASQPGLTVPIAGQMPRPQGNPAPNADREVGTSSAVAGKTDGAAPPVPAEADLFAMSGDPTQQGAPPLDAVTVSAELAIAATAQVGTTPVTSRGRTTPDRNTDHASRTASAHVQAASDTAADPATAPMPKDGGAPQDTSLTQPAPPTHRDSTRQWADRTGVEVAETRADAMPIAVSRSVTRAATGVERISMRLDPSELGSVTFDIRTNADGQRDIRITVEKADTLALLRQDRHQLELALGRAGIAVESVQIQMSLARQDVFRAESFARDTTGAAGWMTGDPPGQPSGSSDEHHPPASQDAPPRSHSGTTWTGGVADAVPANWAGTRVGPALNIVA